MGLAVQHGRNHRRTRARAWHEAAIALAVHQQIAVAELARNLVRKISADALGARIPVQDPMIAIHHADALIQPIQQSSVQARIEQSQLDDRLSDVWMRAASGSTTPMDLLRWSYRIE